MAKHLRWKKEPKETGLRRIFAPPRGSCLHDGENEYAHTGHLGFRDEGFKWYWTAPSRPWMPHRNTCSNPVETEQQAKDAAFAYVKHHLAQREKLKGN